MVKGLHLWCKLGSILGLPNSTHHCEKKYSGIIIHLILFSLIKWMIVSISHFNFSDLIHLRTNDVFIK